MYFYNRHFKPHNGHARAPDDGAEGTKEARTPIAAPAARRHGRPRGCIVVLSGFLPCLCGMSTKFVDADNEAAVVWPWETKMLYGQPDARHVQHPHACPGRVGVPRHPWSCRPPSSAPTPRLSADGLCTFAMCAGHTLNLVRMVLYDECRPERAERGCSWLVSPNSVLPCTRLGASAAGGLMHIARLNG